jgi:hypothetical protein
LPDDVSGRRASVVAAIAALSVGWAASLSVPSLPLTGPAFAWMILALSAVLWTWERSSQREALAPAPPKIREAVRRKEDLTYLNGDQT